MVVGEMYQFHFYLICRYINIKLKELNQMIKLINDSKLKTNSSYIKKLMLSLNSIYYEINEYNTSYWSKYLLTIWLFHGSVIVNILYFVSLTPMTTVTKCTFIYVEINLIITFVLIMNTASAVNYEVNKSYKLVNSFMAHNVYRCKSYKSYLFLTNIKVNIKIEIQCNPIIVKR